MADGALNGQVSLREYLGDKFTALEDKIDAYNARLDDRIDADNKRLDDHEQRIRAVEKKSFWSNVSDIVIAVGAMVGTIWAGKP